MDKNRTGSYVRTAVFFLTVLAPVLLVFSSPRQLRAETSTAELCTSCHPKASSYLRKANVHKPVKLGLCTSCHSPHVSKHSGLLSYSAAELCYKCHDRAGKAFTGEVVHAPVKEGKCLVCHDSHSSDNPSLVKQGGAESCFSCHPKEALIGKKNVHPEVKKGNCLACHRPHASANEGLLSKERNRICAGCHGAGEKYRKSHSGFDITGSDCLSCHSPHASDKPSLLKASLHKPFEEKKCAACHPGGNGKVTETTTALCLECHKMEKLRFNRMFNHLASPAVKTFKGGMCAGCHDPHASDEKYLMKYKETKVCYACHTDTKEFVAKNKHIHPKLGVCSGCHVSHGSNDRFMLAKGNDTCSVADCHPAQGAFTHPVGPDVIDPRSKESMNCSSCHNPMGSPEGSILRGGRDRDLCVKCHQL